MPAVSQSQREYLFATKGKAWVKEHHFDNKGSLPAHVPKKKSKKSRTADLKALWSKKDKYGKPA